MGQVTGIIIQARMGSSRLPGKVLKDIGLEPMLWHVYERASRASLADETIVATSTVPEDDDVVAFCERRDIPCHRGSEPDVLDRFYQTATAEDLDTVVRLTADCPFNSPTVIDQVIQAYRKHDAEYVSNILEYTYPDGYDTEVFGYDLLEWAWEETDDPREREHVTLQFRESPDISTRNVENVVDTSRYDWFDEDVIYRWCVDYPEDLEFVRAVYDRLTEHGHWLFDQHAILELLTREPELREINEDHDTHDN